jgi:hypothetical protein
MTVPTMKKLLLLTIAVIFGIGAVSAEAAKGGKVRPSSLENLHVPPVAIRLGLTRAAQRNCERERSKAQPGQDPNLLVCQCMVEKYLDEAGKDAENLDETNEDLLSQDPDLLVRLCIPKKNRV